MTSMGKCKMVLEINSWARKREMVGRWMVDGGWWMVGRWEGGFEDIKAGKAEEAWGFVEKGDRWKGKPEDGWDLGRRMGRFGLEK